MKADLLLAKAEALEEMAHNVAKLQAEASGKEAIGLIRGASMMLTNKAAALRAQATASGAEVVGEVVTGAKENERASPGCLLQTESLPDYWQIAWRMADVLARHLAFRPADTAPIQAGVPEGWKLVPVELTKEMLEAGDDFMEGCSELGNAYAAMLSAAPIPPEK